MRPVDDPGSIDVGGLLTIDVSSELRKLSQAQFQGPWQLPAELVRRAFRGGASEVRFASNRHGVSIVDDGGGYPVEHLQWTASLLDGRRPNEERHAALTALEAAGELVLLAMAGLDIIHLRIETVHDGVRAILDMAAGRAPHLEVQADIAGRWTSLQLKSAALDRKQVVQWLRNAARFAPGKLTVDGDPIPSGFSGVIVEGTLQPPLQGRLAVVREGESAHVWLLEHGLVTGHITVPDAPNLEAAVELGSSATDLSAARLREMVQPHVPAIVEQGVGLLVRLGRKGPMPEQLRTRVARLVLQAARKGLRKRDVMKVPVFRVIDADGTRQVNLQTLEEIAKRGGGRNVLVALYPSQKPERFALGSTPVLVADAAERSRLAELLHVRFRPPDPRDTSSALWLAWRRGVDSTARTFKNLGVWIRHPVRSPPVDDHLLNPREQAFIGHVRNHLAQDPRLEVTGARMCEGRGPIRRTSGRPAELLLPRHNPTVLASIRAISLDPAWTYPVVLALLDGQGLPAATSRAGWLSRLARSS
jgi:hypothetical protein